MCIAYKHNNLPTEFVYEDNPLPPLQQNLYIAFNAKFDLHWLRKCSNGWQVPKIWCCQLAEFYLSKFSTPLPSLEATAIKYDLGHKVDVVKLEYWDKGIDTPQIPFEVLKEYTCTDVELTYKIYLRQLEEFHKRDPKLLTSFKIACEDLLVLEEMEWNGQLYDPLKCEEQSKLLDTEIQNIYTELSKFYPDIPINFGSGDQLSAFLYGGKIKQEVRTQVGVYKSGAKQGQARYSVDTVEHVLPQVVKPLPSSKLAKEGFYATDAGTLKKLKGVFAKKFVPKLLRLSALEKQNGTYFKGIPQKALAMEWPPNMIHGQFNQCIAKTGRLSSSKPNLQNLDDGFLKLMYSRYD